MLGAIIGDIVGSVYEFHNIKTKQFPLFRPECRFTDDTVLTIAVADAILEGRANPDGFVTHFHEYFASYPDAGYGGTFFQWARARSNEPYNSWGNGSAMRVSPVGWAHDTLAETLLAARMSAVVTHDHPEGIRGAEATAGAIFLARSTKDKDAVRHFIEDVIGYDIQATLDEIRPTYSFDVSCQGTVPVAIRAFLESADYEDALRNAISLGGDSDTLACITGGIAEACHGLPEDITERGMAFLDSRLRAVVEDFQQTFMEG